MTDPAPRLTPFFVTGGTLGLDAASYVERQSDEELFRWLHQGEFCYVLTARQMGKSSLMVRTASRLRGEGIRTLILDLTTLGQGVTPEQWYRGMLAIAGEQLNLEDELDEFWSTHRELGPLQRWFAALRQVVLPRCPHGFVVFVDEIDAVRGLSFRPDDFFAAIRASANGFASGHAGRPINGSVSASEDTPAHRREARLTFCLLGVATPADLIRDTRNTPFNVGHRIVLQDFTAEEAAVFARGLAARAGSPARDANRLLERVLYWTAGQPYLSQRLCKAVADDPDLVTPQDVDRRCADLFLAPGALRRETHLLFAQELLLRSTADVGGLLGLYARIRAGLPVPDDETSPFVSLLRLSGVVRATRGRLRLRNRIYARVFDRNWVRTHLPDAEQRRQRAAFRRGALVVGALGVSVGLLLASITAAALRNQATLRRAVHQRDQALEEWKEANRQLGEANNTLRTQRGLIEQKATALRRSQAQEHAERLAAESSAQRAAAATARAEVATQQARGATARATGAARLAERRGAQTRREVARLQAETGSGLVRESRFLEALPWFISAARLDGDLAPGGESATLIRSLLAESPRLLHLWATPTRVNGARYSPDGKWLALTREDGGIELHSATGNVSRLLQKPDVGTLNLEFSPDGARLVVSSVDGSVRIWDVAGGAPVQLSERAHNVYAGPVFVDRGREMATLEHPTGRVRLWDVRTGKPLRDVATVSVGLWSNLHPLGDTRYLFIGSPDRSQVLDVRTGAIVSTGPALIGPIGANRTGSLLAAADGALVTLWHLPMLTRAGQVAVDRLQRQVVFQPDGRLRSVAVDGTVQDWNPWTYQPMSAPVRVPGPVVVATLKTPASGTSCGREIFTIGPSGVARTWDLAPLAERGRFLNPPAASGPPAFDRPGKLVAMPGEDGWLRVLDTATGHPARAPLRAGYPLASAAFSPDGLWVAAAGYGGAPRLWNMRTGAAHTPLPAPREMARQEGITGLVFSPDGHRLLASRTDGFAQLYDLRTGRALKPIPCVSLGETPRPFSPDGRQLLLRGDGSINYALWDIDRESPTLTAWLEGTGAYAEFSRDGKRVLAAPGDNTLRLWRVPDGRPVTSNPPRGEGLGFATFSPDGSKILTLDTSTGAASLWDSHTFRPLLRPLLSRSVMRRAAFSGDGRRVVIAADNGDLEVWDAENGRVVTAPFNAGLDLGINLGLRMMTGLRFSADGGQVLVGYADGPALVLPIDSGPTIPNLKNLTTCLLGGAPGSTVEPKVQTPEEVEQAWTRIGGGLKGPPPVARAADVRWHREQWRDCERAGLWGAAADHLSQVIDANPTTWQLRERRAQLWARRHRWKEAALDLRAALDLGSTHYLGYYWCALAHLAVGDRAGYQEACAGMLHRFAEHPRLRQRDLTAWTCALGPARREDQARAIAVLQGMLRQEPGQPSWRSTLGALLCRSGRYGEALTYLPSGGTKPDAALDDLFRALAYRGLGQEREAHAALAAGEQAIAAALRPGSTARPSWEDRLEASVLLAEVRARVSPPARGGSR